MNQLSHRIMEMSESETLAMATRSRKLQEKGIDIINLSIGEPDFNTPEFIKAAAKKALDDNITHYTPVAGFKSLREAISLKLKRDNNLDYNPEQIIVSTGAKQSIANAMMSIVNPGEEVLVATPYWVSYREIIKMAGGKPVYVNTHIENHFKVTPEDIKSRMTHKTRAFIFSSPGNPTGTVYSKQELEALANTFAQYPDVYIISDEIYELINFESHHESIAQFDKIKNQVILINGVSKGFAMTGWRIGYMAAHKTIADAAEKFQGQITSGTNAIAQKAALAALLKKPDELTDLAVMRQAFKKRRDLILDKLNKINGFKTYIPEGAFYIFPDISSYFGATYKGKIIRDANDFTDFLLETAHVAVVTGQAFGDNNCIRISYATSEDLLTEAMDRIHKAVAQLKTQVETS